VLTDVVAPVDVVGPEGDDVCCVSVVPVPIDVAAPVDVVGPDDDDVC